MVRKPVEARAAELSGVCPPRPPSRPIGGVGPLTGAFDLSVGGLVCPPCTSAQLAAAHGITTGAIDRSVTATRAVDLAGAVAPPVDTAGAGAPPPPRAHAVFSASVAVHI